MANLMDLLHPDLLLEISKYLCVDLLESPASFTQFAEAWNRAWFDEPPWQCLDFSMFRSHYIRATAEPYVYVASKSESSLSGVLALMLVLSQKRIRTLIFHYDLLLSEDQFAKAAKSCPNLRRLVMPAWDRITEAGMCRAIKRWEALESLTMPSIADPSFVLHEISQHCNNFRELKIMGRCDMDFAKSLAFFLPNLRVLSLRCTTLDKHVLIFILAKLQSLEVLNISHCILMERKRIITEIGQDIHDMAARLLVKLITCMDDSCIMCQRTRDDEGLVRWYRYEKGLWKEDEVSSLAL